MTMRIPFGNFFLSLLDEYVNKSIEIWNSLSDEDMSAVTARMGIADSRSVWFPSNWVVTESEEPLLSGAFGTGAGGTWWGQNIRYQGDPYSPYNRIINKVAGNSPHQWPAGCPATAIAQIMAYWGWPKKPPTSMPIPTSGNSESSTFVSSFNNPYDGNNPKTFASITYEWAKMKAEPHAGDLDDEYKMQIGVLMMHVGYRVKMNYGDDGSSAHPSNFVGALETMRYKTDKKQSYNFSKIVSSLNSNPVGRPVLISATSNFFYSKGHVWILDGYAKTAVNNYVHCNTGWHGRQNGWYLSEVFDMNAGPEYLTGDEGAGFDKKKKGVYGFHIKIFPNIRPDVPTVNIAAIPGVTPPVAGATPVSAITATTQYTGTVNWYIVGGMKLGEGETFAANTQYRAAISLTAEQGYTLNGIKANFFTVAGTSPPATNAANSNFVSAYFPVTEKTISTGALPEVAFPTAGGTPVTSFIRAQ